MIKQKNCKIISIILLAVFIAEFFPSQVKAETIYFNSSKSYNLEKDFGSQIPTPGGLLLSRDKKEGLGSYFAEKSLNPADEGSLLQEAVFGEKIFSGKLNTDNLNFERKREGRDNYFFVYYPQDSQLHSTTTTKTNFIELHEMGVKIQLERVSNGVKYALIPSYRGELFGLVMKKNKIQTGASWRNTYEDSWDNSLDKYANVGIKQSDIDNWVNANTQIIPPSSKVLAIYEKSWINSSCPLIGNCDNWYNTEGYAIAADGRLGYLRTEENHPSGFQIGGLSFEQTLKIIAPIVIYSVAPYLAPAESTLPTGLLVGGLVERPSLKTDQKLTDKIIPTVFAQQSAVKEIELSTADANNILNQIGSQFFAAVLTAAAPFGTVESLGLKWTWSKRKLTSSGEVRGYCGDGVKQSTEQCEPPNTSTCDSNCKIISVPGVGGSGGAGGTGVANVVRVNAALDGNPWSGSLNLKTEEPFVSGCYGIGTPVGATSQKACSYTLDYSVPFVSGETPTGIYKIIGVSGGPAGTSLATTLPYTQTLYSGGDITFNFNFRSSPRGIETPAPSSPLLPVVSTSCGSLTYPANYWHEIYTVHSSGRCLGEYKEDPRWDFDIDWGNGTIDFGRGDDLELNMGRIRNLQAGTYKFTLGSDDGSRLYIDGEQCIDNWGDHGYQEKDCSKSLSSGDHSFWIKYYENGGGARIKFKTETVSLAPPPPPPPPPPSFNISHDSSVSLTILGKKPETCASESKNNTSLITVESLNGFNEDVLLSVADWGGLADYLVLGKTYPQGYNFSLNPLTGGNYESGSVFNLCLKPDAPGGQHTLKIKGHSQTWGDRYADIIINTLLKDPNWKEI